MIQTIEEGKKLIDGETFLQGKISSLHYVKKKSGFQLINEIVDREVGCDFDLILEFKGQPVIQDLDDNGIAEVIICYRKNCTSDISPAQLNVILYENHKVYGLRGYEYLLFPDDEKFGEDFVYNNENAVSNQEDAWIDEEFFGEGKYANDDDFRAAPKSFFEAALKTWKDQVVVKF